MRRRAAWLLGILMLASLLSGCRREPSPEDSSVSSRPSANASSAAGTTTAATVSGAATGTTTVSAPESALPPQTLERTVTPENAAVYGRTGRKNDCLLLEWSGSGFAVRVTGSAVEIRLRAAVKEEQQPPYIRIWIDGEEREYRPVSGSVSLRFRLGEGEHLIRLIRLSEPLTVAPVEVISLRLEGDDHMPPALLEPPVPSSRRIEFIGDSLTCGFGITGRPYAVTGEPGRFLTKEEDVTKTYAGVTAAYFQADARYTAASGTGVCNNHPDTATELRIPQLFALVSPAAETKWDPSLWQPQVVVINAGTNDYRGNTTPDELHTGVMALLEKVRRAYPEAAIIWMYGMMNDKLEESLVKGIQDYNAAWGDRVYYLPVESIDGVEEQGALGHPNAAAHKERAEPLIRLISRLTGWDEAKD